MDTPYYYYTILEVPNDATLSDIKRAYRKKALQYHPDKCKEPHSAEKFKEINQAFHVLSDNDKRHCYDNFGGVERPEIPMTISKPFEEFCEGVALGTFGFIANLGLLAIFGIPFGLNFSGWIAISQFLTAWQMAPPTLDSAKDPLNWSKSLGGLVSPFFLISSASCVVGYAVFNGSKLALEYTKDRMGVIGSSVADFGDQIRKAVQSYTKDESLSLTTEDSDWVMLDEDKSKKKKRASSKPLIIEKPRFNPDTLVSDFILLPSSSSSMDETTSSTSTNCLSDLNLPPQQVDQGDEWVLLDDML